MKAQKVNFIFVEKDPWYKKVVNGISGRSSGSGRYGCSVHGFKTDSSKYKFSSSVMKKSKKHSTDGVAFSDGEPIYPKRRGGNEQNEGRIPIYPGNEARRENRAPLDVSAPIAPIHEDRRVSAAQPVPQRATQQQSQWQRPAPPQAYRSDENHPPRQSYSAYSAERSADRDMADKLSRAFDNYDSSVYRSETAQKIQDGLREKTQSIREASADRLSAAKDRFNTASQKEDSVAAKVKNTYERTSERLHEAKHALLVWGVGSAVGLAVLFAISLLIVNANSTL
ncbi:MAG: hypothetical protein LBC58_00100 [Clostridiales Family XIII bacterium]|jgi:ElaB/YqjD/DUF883 family membrane-anchored ribosome-binding protein|nr:hypothetical protein [Clostridiales Family XIII bacterium]